MKFSGKKVVALIIALMMCSTMVTAFADDPATIQITSVKILNSASDVGTDCPNFKTDSVVLSEAQLLQITAEVTGVADAQVSFMSYGSGATEYTDATIQYLDQKAAASGTATFAFRPRSARTGTFVAMTGATSVTLADSFDYTVVAADKDMTVTGGKSYYAGEAQDTVLTIHALIEEIESVKIGEEELTPEEDYTVAPGEDGETTLVTILAGAIPDAQAGTLTVTISAAGYNDGTAKIIIKAPIPELPEETDPEDAQGALNTEIDKLEATKEEDGSYSVDISDAEVTVGETPMTVTFEATNLGAGVEEKDGKLVFDPDAENAPFVGKATVVAILAKDVAVTKEVYFIPEGTVISYGNVTALTSNGTEDAFAITGVQETDDANFEAWITADENVADVKAAKAKALAIGAGRADADTIAAAADTLDFNRRDGISLNEYNIYRKMIGCFDGFGITAVNNARAQYNN